MHLVATPLPRLRPHWACLQPDAENVPSAHVFEYTAMLDHPPLIFMNRPMDLPYWNHRGLTGRNRPMAHGPWAIDWQSYWNRRGFH